mmetsp:Transcript_18162/g.57039  ORF Transcript_18162/g.57039 Transcript_18162/m.57039 type:complete len:251 (-) Transcript_18162:252-1004(-)
MWTRTTTVVLACAAGAQGWVSGAPSTGSRLVSRAVEEEEAVKLADPPLTTLPSRTSRRKPKSPALNGWVPDYSRFCYGLPGACLPLGEFDPLGFAAGASLDDVRRYREAEVMHSRVAMMASVGYLAGEYGSPLVWHGKVGGPANDQLAQIPTPLFMGLTIAIGVAETYRARRGWVEPSPDELFQLRPAYYPGDLGFDPLKLKPADPTAFADLQTRELNNGRLAMIAVAGMCAQEQVTHATIADTLASFFP